MDTTRFNLVDNKAIFNNCEIDLVHAAKGKEMMKPIKWYLNLDYDDETRCIKTLLLVNLCISRQEIFTLAALLVQTVKFAKLHTFFGH